eukprot:TCONS_00032968-protein
MVAHTIAHECLQHGFVLGRSLGEGGYGQVKQASYVNFNCPIDPLARRLRSSGRSDQVAIKVMPTSRGMAPIIMELNAMNLLKGCQNVVQMLDFFHGENHCYLVMELCKEDLMTTLNERMHTKPNISEIFTQVMNGVHQCHLKSIAHCDLKLENVLIDHNGAVKITDFGLGIIPTLSGNGCKTFCGTPEYMAPEVLRGYIGFDNTPYNPFKADMWSLGAILYAMLTGKFLPIN